ncbi:serine/threonine protein kinase [Streptomyces sp. SID10853]|uniref:serine/threonine-protein kinase n=1 Tax=Streptomyces sp. SID10853 TaxID=2706028 RepID=UPI0013C09D53|nr:serine/threonine-protein kinase [Streptomyces sp. SID10853]NDZ80670.1 serine/threonine protein kinase [Streptomyces sp. SID10853]
MTVGGRYQVQRVLGRGGFGEVWEALDHNLNRRVAIKFITGVAQYPEAARRFAREARILASLNHGSIVTVHDAGTIDHGGLPLPYLVMEMLHGGTWETAWPDSAVETGARLADALAHVHAANVVHRDVKPANIMICTDGRTVLMDFGIARDDNSLTRTVTTTGKAFGTPAYMAPEQFGGAGATPASDVYALGLVLVEKLTGQRGPAAQLTGAARAAVPGHLVPLLTRMTSHLPQDRPSAAECARQLRAPAAKPTLVLPGGGAAAPGLSGAGAVVRSGSLRARLAAPGALLALFLVSGFIRAYSYGGPHNGSLWSGPVRGTIGAFAGPLFRVRGQDFSTWDAQAWAAVTTPLVILGLGATLALTAGLVPGAGTLPRLGGYAAAALAVAGLSWQAANYPPWYDPHVPMEPSTGMWLFYLATALTIGEYIRRDVRNQRPAAQVRLPGTPASR